MKRNEYALLMTMRWRKLYHFRNRTRMSASDRLEAAGRLKLFIDEKRHRPHIIIP